MITSLDEMFMHFLHDLHDAEQQLLLVLPTMADHALLPALKDAFIVHAKETAEHVERLDEVFAHLGGTPQPHVCAVMQGLSRETADMVAGSEPGPIRDAGLIACAQAVEHYEMARYTALIEWAQCMGETEVVALLQQSLDEEKLADAALNDLAVKQVITAALTPPAPE